MISVSDIVILAASSTLLAVAMARTDLSGDSLATTPVVMSSYSTTDFDTNDVKEPAIVSADQIDVSTLNSASEIETTANAAAGATTTVSAGAETTAFKEPEIIREAKFNTHVVRSGEYLSLLAQRYNTTVSELMALNNLTSSTILVGQSISYPSP